MSVFDFSGQTVLVSGGTSGINLGIARAFARTGHRMSVFSRSADKVEAAVEALGALAPSAHGGTCDVRNDGLPVELIRFGVD